MRMALVAVSLSLFVLTMAAPSIGVAREYTIHGTRTVDGDPSDWVGTPPATSPGYVYSGGEFIVSDPDGDESPYWDSAHNWPIRSDVDIVEFRLTSDDENMYFLFKFSTYESLYSHYIMVAIDPTPDTNNDGFNQWLPDYSDTRLGGFVNGEHVEWNWTYIVAINYDWGDDANHGNSPIGVYNQSWDFTPVGTAAFSQDNRVIEASVPLSAIGGADLYRGGSIRIWIIVFANSYGGIWDPYDNGATDDLGNPCTLGTDAYDVAGQSPTVRTNTSDPDSGEFWDDDGNAGNDAWPTTDSWVDTSFVVSFNDVPEPIPENAAVAYIALIAAATATIYTISRGLRGKERK